MRLSYLVQRGNLYYFQCRVPADMKHYFPGTQIRKSLKTDNRKQALTQVKILTAKTERLFFMARSQILTPKMIESLVQEYMDTMLEVDKQRKYGITENAFDEIALQSDNDFKKLCLMDSSKDYEMYSELDKEMVTVSGGENLARYYRMLANQCQEKARKQDYKDIAPQADFLLSIESVAIKQNSPEYRMFCDSLLAKEAEANEVLALRAERGFNNEYDKAHISRPIQHRKKLSALIAKYNNVNINQVVARSKQKPDEQFGKILELLGNPYTDEISQDMLITLFDNLAKYPKYRNHKHMKGLTLEECYKHPKYEPLDVTTFKGVWFALGALLIYGSENGEYGIARNISKDQIFSVKMKVLVKTKKDKPERLPYSQDNIQSLVVQLAKRHRLKFEPHKLWIPLIALYNGMRQGEICQLFCDDFITVDGIDCFRIRDCDERHQSVKNEQSQRTIPIHPMLLKLGLMDFITSRRKLKYERPWQGMKSRPVDYYEVSDSYNHYAKSGVHWTPNPV